MTTDLRELYQEVLLDHNRRPRNFQKLADADRTAEGFNPLCGDQVTIYLKVDGDVIRDVSFLGSGCAISKSAASMMTVSLKGKTVAEAEALFEKFHRMLTGKGDEATAEALGKLAVFQGVTEFPIRVKCATLPWHTLHAALQGTQGTVSTE